MLMDITYTYLLHDCIKNIKDCTHLVPCCHILPVTLIIEIKNCIEHSRECFVTYNYTLMSCERLVPALRSTKSHLHDFKKDYARPTDENSCVDIHGKLCASHRRELLRGHSRKILCVATHVYFVE